ncbi:MAG: phospholipid carrier-dependent glycosyltransferase [Planctomycetes bacterium]|nr:phospholipid carrier-dependent glycosyltransferase [Planctomycetota bacterium]
MPSRSSTNKTLAAAVTGLLLLRFVAIERDPPGGIATTSGAFLTDEGYYLKAAALYHAFGSWRSEHDPNWYVLTPLYALLTVAMGYVFHPLLLPARYLSVACSVGCIAAFYAVCRRARSRAESLVCCLLAAAAFDNFAFSRVAFVEPMGTLFGLLALYFWVAWRGRWTWAVASCACAGAAMLTKLNLVYTPAAVGLLWLWQARAAWRGGERRRALGIGGILTATACLGGLAVAVVVGEPGEARHLRSSTANIADVASLGDVVSHEAQLFWYHLVHYSRRALVVAAALGAACWLALGRGRSRPAPGEIASGRPLAAMVAWGAVGMLFFGFFSYQVPRWLTFTIYPLAYVAVSTMGCVAPRRRGVALSLLIAMHLLSQAPAVAHYLARPPGTSLLDMARDVARRLEAEPPPVVLAGNCSYLVGLFSKHVRPIAGEQLSVEQMRTTLRHWRPAYLLAYHKERDALADLFAAFREEAAYTVMSNYFDGHDIVLYRVAYREDASSGASPPLSPGSTGR